MMDPRLVIQTAAKVLDEDRNVLLGYVFGSYGSGHVTPLSDIDVAVLLIDRDLAKTAELWSRLAEALGVSEDLVDVVELSTIGVTLRSRILKYGVRVIDRDDHERKLFEEVLASYPDIRFTGHALIDQTLNGGSLDEASIESRLGQLTKYASLVQRIIDRGKQEVWADELLRGALERYMHLSVESMMDISKHFVSALRLGVPETYRELVDLLISRGIMTDATGSELKELVGLRNILVHRYSDVELETLYAKALKLRDVAEGFGGEIRTSMRTFARRG